MDYFHPAKQRVHPESSFYVQPNSKISVMYYKHKHELYNTLRTN